jgi:hypothetical protein
MLAVFSFNAFAQTPEVTTKCTLLEKASGSKSRTNMLDITTLSPEGQQSVAMKPQMGLDSEALYILSLAKGKDHLDATNEVSGADYYLTLSRQQDETRSIKTKKIRGSVSDMLFLQVKYDMLYKTSYANRKGKLVNGTPKSLVLNYKLARGKRVKLKCEIISIR